jgi:CxxC motif-containing protein (DUF1111 family)
MRTLRFSLLGLAVTGLVLPTALSQVSVEAPTGFDDLSNGFESQVQMDADRSAFDDIDTVNEGLGPVYNAQSCRECHQNPVSGGISQVTEFRAGHEDAFGNFVNPVGGRSLINDRATDPAIQMRMPGSETIRTFRTSLNTLGDGFVEAIDSNTLVAISTNQPPGMKGLFIEVPVLEAGNLVRGGRFGWKNQHASLLSFASDAYLNEQGITNKFNLVENNSLGRSTKGYPGYLVHADPQLGEDFKGQVFQFANFMRSTKAPPRDAALAATAGAQAGDRLFDQVGCNICHVRSITTAPTGTWINRDTLKVPEALGNKVIHPFGDFLLHNVGTSDDVLQNGPRPSADKMRTAPLWGMRTRDRLMHDGLSLTRNEAILRHAGEATGVINNYRNLSAAQKNQLIMFLNSL